MTQKRKQGATLWAAGLVALTAMTFAACEAKNPAPYEAAAAVEKGWASFKIEGMT